MNVDKKIKFTGLYQSVDEGTVFFHYTFFVLSAEESETKKWDLKTCTVLEPVPSDGVSLGDFVCLETVRVEGTDKFVLKSILPV